MLSLSHTLLARLSNATPSCTHRDMDMMRNWADVQVYLEARVVAMREGKKPPLKLKEAVDYAHKIVCPPEFIAPDGSNPYQKDEVAEVSPPYTLNLTLELILIPKSKSNAMISILRPDPRAKRHRPGAREGDGREGRC